MSMWELEGLAESLVRAAAAIEMAPSRRRALFGMAYRLVEGFDVSFVHFRTRDELVAGGFLLHLPLDRHPDRATRADQLDALAAAGREAWLTDTGGDTEALYLPEGASAPEGLWFDPTMSLWRRAVQAGLLTGLAAEPLTLPSRPHIVAAFVTLLATQPDPDLALLKQLHGMIAYLGPDGFDPADPLLREARDQPALRLALAATHERWIDRRFDATAALPYLDPAGQARVRWWCGHDG